MNKVVVITGPTAVGKTSISIKVAKHFKTNILNVDAFQVYKELNIGTSKPTLEERAGIKHLMMDELEPSDNFSIYDYQQAARCHIDNLVNENKLPLVVGGSGLYIDSLLYDYKLTSDGRDDDFEKQYLNLSNVELHELLEKYDYNKAQEIHPNNRKRVLRALEKALKKENQTDDYKALEHPLYDILIIFLEDDRDILYNRINLRVDQMVELGLVEEAEKLFAKELSLQARQAIGYRELFSYFNNEISKEEAIELIKQHSRNYAKRQFTWFRNHPHTINVRFENVDITSQKVINLINEFLK